MCRESAPLHVRTSVPKKKKKLNTAGLLKVYPRLSLPADVPGIVWVVSEPFLMVLSVWRIRKEGEGKGDSRRRMKVAVALVRLCRGTSLKVRNDGQQCVVSVARFDTALI